MPYVPNKTPVVYNRSVSAIKAALPGFNLKLNPLGHINLDSIIGISKQADYVNKVLAPLERVGEIEFITTEPLVREAEQAVASAKKFEDNVDKLLKEEQTKRERPKYHARKPVLKRSRPVRVAESVVEKPPVEEPDEGLDNGTTDG